jgi:hypothetical protein
MHPSGAFQLTATTEAPEMQTGLGPHDIIGAGELVGTLIVFALLLAAFAWMAYRTRRTAH